MPMLEYKAIPAEQVGHRRIVVYCPECGSPAAEVEVRLVGGKDGVEAIDDLLQVEGAEMLKDIGCPHAEIFLDSRRKARLAELNALNETGKNTEQESRP